MLLFDHRQVVPVQHHLLRMAPVLQSIVNESSAGILLKMLSRLTFNCNTIARWWWFAASEKILPAGRECDGCDILTSRMHRYCTVYCAVMQRRGSETGRHDDVTRHDVLHENWKLLKISKILVKSDQLLWEHTHSTQHTAHSTQHTTHGEHWTHTNGKWGNA